MRMELRHVVFVHAHPDDETITTGGTIATLVDAGVGVTVLTCTRGERGEVIPPELAHLEGDGPMLARHRESELAEAMRILGVTDHRYLGQADARAAGLPQREYLDSGMVWGQAGPEPVPDLNASALCSAPLAEVTADIAAVIASVRPDAVVSYDENGGYGHPDHIRVHEAARQAAGAMAVPFFEVQSAEAATGPGVVHLDVTAVLDRKRQALQAHRTQVTVDGDQFALSSGPSLPVALQESYRRRDRVGETELPFGAQPLAARLLACAIGAVLGLAVGTLGTVSHPSSVTLPGVEPGIALPIGLIVALLVVAALLVGLRLVFDSRVPAGLAAAGLAATLVVLAQTGPGGSVLIPATLAGYVWTYGVPLIAAVVLAWPRLPARAGELS